MNPNHFAHYLAITTPFAFFLVARAWHASLPGASVGQRVAALVERNLLPFSLGILAALGSLAGILLAQSRGALLALISGGIFVGVILMLSSPQAGREAPNRPLRLAIAGLAGVLLLLASIAYLGSARTVARFKPLPSEEVNLVGRRVGIESAVEVWKRFPTFGSGLGTFADVVSLAQSQDVSKLYHHAHDDYVEIAATGGTLGVTIAVVAILGGYVALLRSTVGRRAEPASWNRRAFQLAAAVSIAVALAHALFDFNFFIPANAATIAAIAGAAASILTNRQNSRSSRAPQG